MIAGINITGKAVAAALSAMFPRKNPAPFFTSLLISCPKPGITKDAIPTPTFFAAETSFFSFFEDNSSLSVGFSKLTFGCF